MGAAIPPATAQFYKLRIIGGYTDTDIAGTYYFDGFTVRGLGGNLYGSGSIAEQIGSETSWTDHGSFVLPVGSFSADCILRLHFVAEIKTAILTKTVYQRFRVGSKYSNEVSSSDNNYQKNYFTLDVAIGTSGVLTVYQQLLAAADANAYGKKTGPGVMIEVLVP